LVFGKVNDVAKIRGSSTDVCCSAIGKDSATPASHKIVSMPGFDDVITLTALASIFHYIVKPIIHGKPPCF
jgi:hypothetical protein